MFPCEAEHVTCLDCFREYCTIRLHERRFEFDEEYYTLSCPAGCPNSFIREVHHFHLLGMEQVCNNKLFSFFNSTFSNFIIIYFIIILYVIYSTRDIRDLVRRNMFYALVVFCVQDQIAEWVLYHLLWKMIENVAEFSASVDVV